MLNPMCEIYTHFPAEGNSWEENNTLYVYEQFQNSIAFFPENEVIKIDRKIPLS